VNELIEVLDTPITGLDLVIVLGVWLAYRLLRIVGELLGAVLSGRHSDDGGAERRRIEAQDAALREQAARDRQAEQ